MWLMERKSVSRLNLIHLLVTETTLQFDFKTIKAVHHTLWTTSSFLSLAGVNRRSPNLTHLRPQWTASEPAGPCLRGRTSRLFTRQERWLLTKRPPAAAAASRSQTWPPAPCRPLTSTRSATEKAAPAQPVRIQASVPRPSPCCRRCATTRTCSGTVGRF